MNMYLYSVSAFRLDGDSAIVSSTPFVVLKKNKRDAAAECKADMSRLYPVKDGWRGHGYMVFPIEKAFVQKACREVLK